MYGVLANINNVENKEVLLSTDFEPQVDAILDAVTENTKNALCALLTIQLEIPFQMKMSCLLQNFNGLVVIDEAYIDFSKKQSCGMN
jgi:histidinol-phosphate aminotransferase